MKDGGPAFPVCNEANVNDQEGMTLRDYFAGHALGGLLSKLPIVDQRGVYGAKVQDKVEYNRDIAESCYCIADAMLKVREETITEQ